MPGQIYTLTAAEMDILLAAVSNPNIFFDYWFRKPGQDIGWQLDHNFIEGQKWQEEMCMASQPFIVTIAGISTGKTLGTIMAAAYHATLSHYFKFMNVAPTSRQSYFMYQMLLEQAEGTPFQKLITASPKRPWPSISIEFMVGEKKHSSVLEFTSLGESGDATHIFSYRGDWINLEEAGLIDGLLEIMSNLVTRLTGSTAEGRPYLGRLSVISNPWDNIELWQLYDMALADREDGLVFNIDTAANRNTTDKQIKFALKMIPEDMHSKFMTGERPQGRGGYFAGHSIDLCESEEMSNAILASYKSREDGFVIEHNPVTGIWHYRVPRKKGRVYFILGDPGTGAAPARNAPTILVFDVTEAPKFVPIVAMWWGAGGGSIMPFIDKLLDWIRYYKPLLAGVDSTGTQRNTAELLNFDYITGNDEYSVTSITGLDFASTRRYSYLMALRLSIEAGTFQWPKFLQKSVSSQLKNYDPLKDKMANSKLAQDIVATLAMAAFAIRSHYPTNDEEDSEETKPTGHGYSRDRRYSRDVRTFGRDPRR